MPACLGTSAPWSFTLYANIFPLPSSPTRLRKCTKSLGSNGNLKRWHSFVSGFSNELCESRVNVQKKYGYCEFTQAMQLQTIGWAYLCSILNIRFFYEPVEKCFNRLPDFRDSSSNQHYNAFWWRDNTRRTNRIKFAAYSIQANPILLIKLKNSLFAKYIIAP